MCPSRSFTHATLWKASYKVFIYIYIYVSNQTTLTVFACNFVLFSLFPFFSYTFGPLCPSFHKYFILFFCSLTEAHCALGPLGIFRAFITSFGLLFDFRQIYGLSCQVESPKGHADIYKYNSVSWWWFLGPFWWPYFLIFTVFFSPSGVMRKMRQRIYGRTEFGLVPIWFFYYYI